MPQPSQSRQNLPVRRIVKVGVLVLVAGAMAFVTVEPPAHSSVATATQLVAPAKRRPAAMVAGSATLQDSGKVAVQVRSNARKVDVKYRTAKGKLRARRLPVKKTVAATALPAGATQIRVRSRGTSKLRASAWLTLVAASKPAPWVSTSPTPWTSPAPWASPTGSTESAQPTQSTGVPQSPAPSGSPTVSQSPNPTQSGSPAPSVTLPAGTLSAADLREVAGLRVFFGHQSVGGNVLSAVPAVYAGYSVPAPVVNDGVPLPGGSIGNSLVGSNEDPVSKINDFDSWIRSRGAAVSDVAFMKLCYIDVKAGRDITALFDMYRTKMAALQADYPQVMFLHVTNPLTSGDPADNLVRERLNALMRAQYGTSGRLVDLALIESTKPDGTRVTGVYGGQTYYSLHSGYTTDGGHLNDAGAQRVAAELLRVIAAAH